MATRTIAANGLATTVADSEVKLLTFKLDDQEYALRVINVVQVVRMVAVTRAPHAPDYVLGMVNLRGKVIPVIDLRRRLGLVAKSYDVNNQLLIARTEGRIMALVVDAVSEVLMMPGANLDVSNEEHMAECLWAVGRLGDRLVLVLDLDKTLTREEEEHLRQSLAQPSKAQVLN